MVGRQAGRDGQTDIHTYIHGEHRERQTERSSLPSFASELKAIWVITTGRTSGRSGGIFRSSETPN